MRRTLISVLSLAVVLATLAGPALAQKTELPPLTHWSDVPPDTPTTGPNPKRNPSAPTATLTFYNDRTTFENDFPGFIFEDFSGTSVPPNDVQSCPGPFNDMTNNACFSPGAIVPGIEVDNVQNNLIEGNVVLTPPFLGTPCVAVGPNLFADDGVLRFDPPVFGVGLDVVCPLGPCNVNIDIIGASGSLGTDSSPGGLPGTFWGVGSDEAITSIEFVETAGGAELFCDVDFAEQPVPTVTPAGLAILMVIFLGMSVFFVLGRRLG